MRLVGIVGIVVLFLGLAGCMQVKMETAIDKEGGGTYGLTYSVSKDVEQTLEELRGLGGQTAEQMKDAPDFADFDKKEFEAKIGEHGMKLLSFDNKIEGDRRVVTMKLGFESISALSRGLGKSFGGAGMALTKNEDGNYVLAGAEAEPEKEAGEAEEAGAEPDPQAAMQNAAKSMEIMGRLMAHMSELSMQMEITVPGEVLEHNAHRVEGKTCYWSIDGNNMMEAQGLDPRIVFSGKGLDLETD